MYSLFIHYLCYFLLSRTIFLVWRWCNRAHVANKCLVGLGNSCCVWEVCFRCVCVCCCARSHVKVFIRATCQSCEMSVCQFPSVIFPFTCATDNKAPVCVLKKNVFWSLCVFWRHVNDDCLRLCSVEWIKNELKWDFRFKRVISQIHHENRQVYTWPDQSLSVNETEAGAVGGAKLWLQTRLRFVSLLLLEAVMLLATNNKRPLFELAPSSWWTCDFSAQ